MFFASSEPQQYGDLPERQRAAVAAAAAAAGDGGGGGADASAGWGWDDVLGTFIAAETDADFGATGLHGGSGPLPVRRWRDDEMSRAQLSFRDALLADGTPRVDDINDPDQLPGLGVFPGSSRPATRKRCRNCTQGADGSTAC